MRIFKKYQSQKRKSVMLFIKKSRVCGTTHIWGTSSQEPLPRNVPKGGAWRNLAEPGYSWLCLAMIDRAWQSLSVLGRAWQGEGPVEPSNSGLAEPVYVSYTSRAWQASRA